jgi:hypothetical protein
VSITRGAKYAVQSAFDAQGIPAFIQIDPWALLDHAKQHFQGYLAVLRDPTKISERENFERWFDAR